MKEQEMGLPEGWELTTIDKIGKVITGKTPSTKDKNNFDGKIPFVKPNDLDVNGFIYTTTQTLSEQGVKSIPTLPKNSIMVTCIGNLGKVGITTKEITATNQQINSIIPFEGVDYKYIYFQLLTLKNWLESESSATTISIINKSKFSKAPILLPSYEEQQHLSQKLTALLDGVAEAKQRLEKIPALLKQFRQSVLADAVSGKLINEEFIEKNTLKDCADILNGARKPISSKEREKIQGIIPYYGATGIVDYLNDFTHNGRFLLVGEDGANLLTKVKDLAYIVEGKVWVNNHAHVLKEKIGFCLDFIKISINALDLSPWVTGSAQPKLTKKALENLPIPKATFEQQTQIIQKVETYFALADKIEIEAAHALEKVNLLTQSILAKAFRGELSADWRAENGA